MNRRTLLALAPLLALTRPARAAEPRDAADIARVEAYLNGLHTLKARFIQIGPDGRETEGTAWLDRPGRMRFQYDPPTPLLLVAGYGLFVYYDSQLKQTTNIPLGQTPLGILLAEHVDLGGAITVQQIDRQPGLLQLTLARASAPGDGSLTLVFTDPPLALRQWSVVDAQRQETRVTLQDVALGGSFDQGLFAFVNPDFFNPKNNNR